jgi:hypothetical protein
MSVQEIAPFTDPAWHEQLLQPSIDGKLVPSAWVTPR